ncbi:hypothetical protein BBJ28_00013574 [Nothophytophthora sp. Chile5]|nr:hypothetical protein BBJ28_00013574 [Nothophytophthora sp. Chile5]
MNLICTNRTCVGGADTVNCMNRLHENPDVQLVRFRASGEYEIVAASQISRGTILGGYFGTLQMQSKSSQVNAGYRMGFKTPSTTGRKLEIEALHGRVEFADGVSDAIPDVKDDPADDRLTGGDDQETPTPNNHHLESAPEAQKSGDDTELLKLVFMLREESYRTVGVTRVEEIERRRQYIVGQEQRRALEVADHERRRKEEKEDIKTRLAMERELAQQRQETLLVLIASMRKEYTWPRKQFIPTT